MKDIDNILRTVGPSLSSVVVKILTDNGLSPAAARKRVSRANGTVERLNDIEFPNREKFLFLPEHQISGDFRHKLIHSLINSGSYLGRALIGLESRGGAVLAHQFPIASGLPVEKAKGHVLHAVAVERLRDIRLIEDIISADGNLISIWDAHGQTARRRAAIVVEGIVLSVLRTWLIKMGWSSSNTLQTRDDEGIPRFGQFAWDMVGPCYLAGLVNYRNNKLVEGFIAGDIILDRTISEADLVPFFAKWNALIAQRRETRLQPVFIGEFFESGALALLRKRGCMVAIPATIFGEEAARALHDLIDLLAHAAKTIVDNPNAVFDLIARLNKIGGASLNLRGVVIELIIARLYGLRGYRMDIRQIVRAEGKQAEIDVKATSEVEVVCCECKGKYPGVLVGVEEIKDWVDRSWPVIKNWLKHSETLPTTRRFEFYSSTDYTPEAKVLIAELKATHIRLPIEFLTGGDVLKQLRARHQNTLVKIFQEQFCTE